MNKKTVLMEQLVGFKLQHISKGSLSNLVSTFPILSFPIGPDCVILLLPSMVVIAHLP